MQLILVKVLVKYVGEPERFAYVPKEIVDGFYKKDPWESDEVFYYLQRDGIVEWWDDVY